MRPLPLSSMRSALMGCVLALMLSAGVARADVAPYPPHPPATPSVPVKESATTSAHHGRRTLLTGLLAALFLIVGGAAGRNDKAGQKTK